MNKINYNYVLENTFKLEEIMMIYLQMAADFKDIVNRCDHYDVYINSTKKELEFLDNIIESINIQKMIYEAILLKKHESIERLLNQVDKNILKAIVIINKLSMMSCCNISMYIDMLDKFKLNQQDHKDLYTLIKIINLEQAIINNIKLKKWDEEKKEYVDSDAKIISAENLFNIELINS